MFITTRACKLVSNDASFYIVLLICVDEMNHHLLLPTYICYCSNLTLFVFPIDRETSHAVFRITWPECSTGHLVKWRKRMPADCGTILLKASLSQQLTVCAGLKLFLVLFAKCSLYLVHICVIASPIMDLAQIEYLLIGFYLIYCPCLGVYMVWQLKQFYFSIHYMGSATSLMV